jgi:hypothetical protein
VQNIVDNIRMISKDMFSSEKDICYLARLHLNPKSSYKQNDQEILGFGS